MNICQQNSLPSRRSFLAGLALAGASCLAPGLLSAQQPANPARKAATKPVAKKTKAAFDLTAIIDQTLARNPYYSPGFLISRVDVQTAIGRLVESGTAADLDTEELYDSLLPESSPLVKRLKTPNGRAFMKKIVNDPAAYDRLERLSWTADGRKLLDSYLGSKDGFDRFQKLKTAADLAKVSKSLAADPRTADYGMPTGHIHTADQLLKRFDELLPPQAADQAAPR